MGYVILIEEKWSRIIIRLKKKLIITCNILTINASYTY